MVMSEKIRYSIAYHNLFKILQKSRKFNEPTWIFGPLDNLFNETRYEYVTSWTYFIHWTNWTTDDKSKWNKRNISKLDRKALLLWETEEKHKMETKI